MSDDRKVSVSAEPLRELLNAFNGPSYLVRELQAIRGITDSPIDRLIKEYNAEIERLNDEQVRGPAGSAHTTQVTEVKK